MTEYASPIFQCVVRQKYSTDHAWIARIKKVRKILNKGETFGALLTDLSKYHAPNFDMNALHLIFDYLTERKQGVKIKSSFSSYLDVFQCIPQGSILGPLLFNQSIQADIMSYADSNTVYVCSENVDVILEKLEIIGKVLFG